MPATPQNILRAFLTFDLRRSFRPFFVNCVRSLWLRRKEAVGLLIFCLIFATFSTFKRTFQTTKLDLSITPFLTPESFGKNTTFRIHLENFNLKYKVPQPNFDVCAGVRLLILVISKPDGFYAREQIRKTWMHDMSNPPDYRTFFLIGHCPTPGLKERIEKEQREFGDLIRYYANDTYELLFVKTHAAFTWQQTFCSRARFLLKTDDDTVLDLARLDHYVRTEFEPHVLTNPKTFFCNRWSRLKPFRDSKNRW